MWAVGSYTNSQTGLSTLIAQWNGTGWQQVPSPNPASGFNSNRLDGVTATARTDAWAVGSYSDIPVQNFSLIEHWDGTSWSQVPSPNPGSRDNALNAVTALSPASAWAVGNSSDSTGQHSLIAHWDGSTWQQVASPSPGTSVNVLNSVAETAPTDAWAVGDESDNGFGNERSLILHWDGSSWTQVPSPNPGSFRNILFGVSAVSATDAWAVGVYSGGSDPGQTLILHWDGTTWSQVPSPAPGTSGSYLRGVAATSATSAWAVGSDASGATAQTLVTHWNGRKWKQVASSSPGSSDFLNGVGAISATNVWTAGGTFNGTTDLPLAIHCH